MVIDKETLFENELNKKINFYTTKALTDSEIDELIEEHEAQNLIFIGYEGDEIYSNDIVRKYKIIGEDNEPLPF
jgi:hypothetical protein